MNKTYDSGNKTQGALWNGSAGQAWVENQTLLDTMFQPIADLLLDTLADTPDAAVLDVGCGAGATTVDIARRVAPHGRCTGIDVSAPMITAARARAAQHGASADFVCADAQGHDFGPARFDLVVSRFGVMFFDDPVAAFAGLRRATRSKGRLRFIAWRTPAENPFHTVAEHAARPLLPQLPQRRPNEPGQFGFADREHVARILEQAGWRGIDIRPADIACAFPAHHLPTYMARMGAVGRALDEADAATRTAVMEALHPVFAPFIHGEEVRFTAACWDVRASAAPGD